MPRIYPYQTGYAIPGTRYQSFRNMSTRNAIELTALKYPNFECVESLLPQLGHVVAYIPRGTAEIGQS